MRAAHGVISYWALELVITRARDQGTEILLTVFDGGVEKWRAENFWHIPGGYNNLMDQGEPGKEIPPDGWGMKSIQPVANRIAKRELGTDVRVQSILDVFWWPRRAIDQWEEERGQHPYGTPLSIYVECKLLSDCAEWENLFFPISALPSPIVKPHKEFILAHFC